MTVNNSTKKKKDKEMVDVVDENGNVLYSLLKTEVHKKGLLHKTVIGEVRNSKGHIMVIEQASDRQEPGKYVNPVGGHVSAGESEEDALTRETLEELGIKGFEFKLVGRAVFNREILNRYENHFFCLYQIITDKTPSLGAEAVSFKWFTEEEYKNAFKNTPEIFGASHHFVVGKFHADLLS
jgi:isopentenyldiphosphate isomerase